MTGLVPFSVPGNLVADVAQRLARLPSQPEEGPYTHGAPIDHRPDHASTRFLGQSHIYLLAADLRVCTAVFELNVPQNAFCFHDDRSEEHTSELQSLMRISYAV